MLLPLSAVAQTLTVKQLFINPEPLFDVCLMISHTTRQDLVDYCEANYTNYTALDRMGSKCSLDTISDNYLCAQLSASTTELCLLNNFEKKLDKIFVVEISTLNTPIKDSVIRMYNGKMKPLEIKKYLKVPTIEDFIRIPADDKTSIEDIADIIDMQFISCTFDAQIQTLIFTQHAKELLSKEDYAKVEKYLLPTITRHWNGKKFE